MTPEHDRLDQDRERTVYWKRWGPYVSERAWGTVREDYSPDGSAWKYLPHDQARSKAYRWGEDGLAGICDRHQQICFALALWNGRDPILKERLFGVSGSEGNHGADVKEYYYYLDNTPTHSYMKYLYKYPQAEYPYAHLVEKSKQRGRIRPEYELIDTGVFDDDRYFDLYVEYAKASSEDILVRLTVINRGPETATLDLLPTLWFRNTWTWHPNTPRPMLSKIDYQLPAPPYAIVKAEHHYYGQRWLFCKGIPDLLFTENETNLERLYGVPNASPYVKDGINDYIVHGKQEAVNPAEVGTKMAAHYHLTLAAGETQTVQLRFSNRAPENLLVFGEVFANTFKQRIQEADDFYATLISPNLSEDAIAVQRQAFAGMLWNKQFYYYDIKTWLAGDPGQPPPPPERLTGRNHEWTNLFNEDVISMPDKWEYPAYASWNLAFHCVTFAYIDPDFAKQQLLLLLLEWYMHSNGQIPANEWAFGDVHPPIHAWAAYRVYKIEEHMTGRGDRDFLESIFQKLLLNFTWWVNRKDYEGQNVFQGDFLGLDNIGVFDRNMPLPNGTHLEQSDATSWMGMYCLDMLNISLELARENYAYSDIASKFFEHFIYIAHAMNDLGSEGHELWNEQDGFYYDVLYEGEKTCNPLQVRSIVGLIPLFAITILESDLISKLPSFQRRMQWFINNWEDINEHIERSEEEGYNEHLILAIVNSHKLPRILKVMLDESEFLSPYGIRSLSRYHLEHPFKLDMDGARYHVDYRPGETSSGRFGGNSNWRGPIWFPLNFLIIESLQTFYHFYGDEFKVEFPTGSGNLLTLEEIADELARRLTGIFLRNDQGRRPFHGGVEKFQHDPHWRDLILFYEYFHGDNGAGIGASHQTGWTGLVANLLQRSGEPYRHILTYMEGRLVASNHTGRTRLVAHPLERSSEHYVPVPTHQELKEYLDRDEDLNKVDYSHADLSGADLREIYMREANLSGADLSEADLRETDLHGADFTKAWLFKALLFKADLSDANLSRAHLRGVDLSSANLSRTDLSFADLREANLSGADLTYAFLTSADLSRANLNRADLRGADLYGTKRSGIDLRQIYLSGARLTGIKLSRADLGGTDLSGVELISTILSEADLSKSNLSRANLREADLSGANLKGANLSGADLRGVKLIKADLSGANFSGVDLSDADLSGANLSWAILSDANLSRANLTGCSIYAISAWNVQLKDAIQSNLIITRKDEPTITVDNLEVAQFIYLMLNNQKIRDVIETMATKAVLILGRFTPERKAILDALREELRKHNYLPILFDFEKPTGRNFTETVRTLAHLVRFVIADLTDPSSIPHELQAVVPTLAVPVQPVLLEGKREYAMFVDFMKTYHWVLPVYYYMDQDNLLASLKEHVIEPAEQKAKELETR